MLLPTETRKDSTQCSKKLAAAIFPLSAIVGTPLMAHDPKNVPPSAPARRSRIKTGFEMKRRLKLKVRLLTAVFVLVMVFAGACRKESTETTAGTPSSTETATAMQSTTSATAAASYDLQFLDTMSKHHESAIQMARMAQGKVQLPGLKELTKRIPADQQKEIVQMKSWRDQWYPGAAPAENMQMPGMSSSMPMDMSHMESMKSGKSYDAMFIDMMVPHHESAVQMSKDALGKAEHQEVKTLAQQIIDAQQKEIDQMKQWKAKLGK